MKKSITRPAIYFVGSLSLLAFAATIISSTNTGSLKQWTSIDDGDGIVLVKNSNGPTLGYSSKSGVKILTVDGLAFKDLNKNGKLDKYEDWRLPVEERAKDLASQMSLEQIAGLMLYSAHQAIPAMSGGPFAGGTYNGKKFSDGGIDAAEVTDQQKSFLLKDNLRHVLITSVQSPEVAARWNNNVQALVEGAGLGIPANNSSDPRHGTSSGVEYTAGAGGKISQWPDQLGLAATFDPDVVKKFGHVASQEYRALGIATALSPQIDLGSEPRWSRINGTFGEDPQLDADMARAYVDGFQTSTGGSEIKDGWGYHSVNAMMKHWPGGGPEEGGRDAHFAYGKFAVYPGNNFDEHLVSFVDGALHLHGKTKMAAAVMPYYTISYGRDTRNKENEGNSYNKYLITDLLRGKYHYDGVICTDWLVTADEGKTPDQFLGKSWGMETKTVAERHYKVMMAGVDQFGGNNESGPVIEAYQMGVKEHGEAFMRARFEKSAQRLLTNIFRTGLFENPYLNATNSKQTVGKPEFMTAGYNAQLKSVILLKNNNHVLPLKRGITIYLPKKYTPSMQGFFGPPSKEHWDEAVKSELFNKYFNYTDDPAKADCAVVFVSSPYGGAGYDKEDVAKGGNGYVPITLQYGEYKATHARAHSIAAGDPSEPGVNNRSYKDKTITAGNYNDLKTIRETKAAMKGKPIVVVLTMTKPTIPAEFEKDANAIVADFGVQNQAILDILSGAVEPSGLLPFQMPANMKTVELQDEDIPHDMVCYKDADGHTYDFGFGMNWKGVIHDARTAKYVGIVKKPVINTSNGIVSITCATPGAKIYYTTDDATPSFIAGNEYRKPFKANKGAVIKAIAKIYGKDNSSMTDEVVK
ncbi:glycoside hydrolase family 3 N-terminal domain-containing protein [Mucilaginibacter sp. BT774]|uniref:glycoside hydrolase family 3 N-terminal domain-containing protein n=1 Tax=Mucilaginibacter sp. BT774 TaxID=3062276 RepID=UPI00267561E9|nr:glycoside hydrolase family 3 N-terminal domain-containing protein [Mucilaginibacter sp. BT774]MDO3625294.1 glycoside hydrolase family 3 N-terminal domain-containing protein [Mucilaginibacter sp. BT774]